MQFKPIALLLAATAMTAGAAHAGQGCTAEKVKAQAERIAGVTVEAKLAGVKRDPTAPFSLAPYAAKRQASAMQMAAYNPAAAIGGARWLMVSSDAAVIEVTERETAAQRAELIVDSCLPYAAETREALKRYIVTEYLELTHAEVYVEPRNFQWGISPEALAMASAAVYYGAKAPLIQLSAGVVKGG